MTPSSKPTFQHPQPQSEQPITGQVYSTAPTNDELLEQVQELKERLQKLENSRINFNSDLIGLFESLSIAPTGLPISPYDQVKIAKISGTTYLYIYDYNQKTGGSASNGWFRVAIS